MNPVRFIHTADVHLDTSFSGAGLPSRLGDRKREAIRAAFRRILEDARGLPADLVLIAGDLFEHERIRPDTVEFLRQQLAALGDIPVFVAPGNHDPFLAGSPYREDVWPPNVHIFREEDFRSVELPDLSVRISGFGFNRNQMPDPPFAGLPVLPRDGTNIVVAHASDMKRVPRGKIYHGPFRIEEIAGKNVGYCALGHYHQQRAVENLLDAAQVWYCGIPEGRSWEEEEGGGYLLGEIDGDGKISVERRSCSAYPFRTLAVDCEGFSSREQIVDAVIQHRGVEFDASTILRVRLTGSIDPRLDLSWSELEERLSGEALYLAWEDQTEPAFDLEALACEKTLRGEFVRLMNEQAPTAAPGDREIMERARLYGLQALLGREVRLK
jgi:DNA repair exonuclease SbcCD nuclease subunit